MPHSRRFNLIRSATTTTTSSKDLPPPRVFCLTLIRLKPYLMFLKNVYFNHAPFNSADATSKKYYKRRSASSCYCAPRGVLESDNRKLWSLKRKERRLIIDCSCQWNFEKFKLQHSCRYKWFIVFLFTSPVMPSFVSPLCNFTLKVHTAILAKLSFYGCHVVVYATDRVTHNHNGLIHMGRWYYYM